MTRYLNFSEDFTEKIKRRIKRATLRLGIKDYQVGEVVVIRAGENEIGQAVIREVNIKKLSELTEEDVHLDGFETREELLTALRRFYGDIDRESIFTQIIFELI